MARTMKKTASKKRRTSNLQPEYDMNHVVAIIFIIIAISMTLMFSSYPG